MLAQNATRQVCSSVYLFFLFSPVSAILCSSMQLAAWLHQPRPSSVHCLDVGSQVSFPLKLGRWMVSRAACL